MMTRDNNLPARTAAPLPPMTPYVKGSRGQSEIATHRAMVSVLIEVVLEGYWRENMSNDMRSAILSDWCDELEDWPVESIKGALRLWRRENPSKKPNPGHIVQLLKKAWGEKNAPAVRAALALAKPAQRVDLPPLEVRKAISDELAEKFPGLIKRIEPLQEQASAAKVRADIEALNIEGDTDDRSPE